MNTTTSERIRKVITALATGIVKYDRDVEIDVIPMANLVETHAWVNQADMGVIVGSKGANVQALEQIALYIASQDQKSATFRLEEARVGVTEPRRDFVPQPKYDPEVVRRILAQVAAEIFDCPCTVTHQQTGKISTTYQVTVAAGHGEPELKMIGESLNTLIHARGKAKHGRLLFVGVTTANEPAQPKTANGRFATETEAR